MEKTSKFVKELGSLSDFVNYLRSVEVKNDLSPLKGFGNNMCHPRYLMLQKGGVPIVDFRHFFAAMVQRLEGSMMRGMSSEGGTLFLGIANEIGQCLQETSKWSFNSCLSPEDLGSNRLGVAFAETVIIKRAEANRASMASLLQGFLMYFDPLPASEVQKLKSPGVMNNVSELATQMLQILSGLVISKAY